ncbi:MAG: GNAT family N-acetyltransferase [Ignavibacteriaceae bacterium]
MQIVDLTEKYYPIYFVCLEDWSDDIKEAGNHKEMWFNKFKEKGLRVKLAVENEKVCGMIQYLPIEYSFVEGKELYFIKCIWVHGHKQGIGNFQRRGIGTSLLNAAEKDVKNLGGKAKRASLEFGRKVDFQKISTTSKETFNEWGISDAFFIDGKNVRTGPPPSYEKIRKLISKRVNGLKV